MPRAKLVDKDEGGGAYFAAPKSHIEFIPTGARLLDCVIGGGYPLGRISNIVGDKSTGKTLLFIEAAVNFVAKYKSLVKYREVESAFDDPYAEALGLPLDYLDRGKDRLETVEDLADDLSDHLKTVGKDPSLYCCDSLDALSDRAEMAGAFGEASYGTAKAKMMSQLFRRLVGEVERTRTHFMVISQVRDNIGVTFGRKTTRSGGRALDFYASQVLYLAHKATIKRTIRGVERPYGLSIKAKCDKNKIGLPLRDCEFDILFGFGVDDLMASLEWLKEVKRLGELGIKETELKQYAKDINSLGDSDYRQAVSDVGDVVEQVWRDIEQDFLPTRRKY